MPAIPKKMKFVGGSVMTAPQVGTPKPRRPVSLPVKAEESKPINVQTDFISLGQAVALADLAEGKGLTVLSVQEFPDHLRSVGLPEKVPHRVANMAHQLFRDRIDAMLFRNNRPLIQQAPVLSREEAEEVISRPVPKPRQMVRLQGREEETEESGTVTQPAPRPKQPLRTPNHNDEGTITSKVIKAPKSERANLWGFVGTAMCRWFGANGFTFEQTKAVLTAKGLGSLSDNTLKIQMKAGEKKDVTRGEIPVLTDAQVKELKQLAGIE